MVDFIKGIENLKERLPEHKIVEELSSVSGRFVDVNEFPESKTAESLLNVLDTKFNGKEDLFIKVASFINEESEKLIYMNELDKIRYKFVLNGFLNLLKSGNIDALENINLDEINLNSVRDDVFFNKLKDTLEIKNTEKKPRFEISEKIINRANVNEEINEKDEDETEEDENAVHHPLWYVLDNIDEKDAPVVYVEDDNTENAEEKEFKGETVLIGDKSKLHFSEEDAVVSVGNKVNTLNISHDKNVEVPNVAMTSTFNGVVDYMEAKEEIPFEFTVNTKTEDFKQNFISSIIYFVRKDIIANRITSNSNINGVSDEPALGDKISSFLINGMSISYDDFATFKNYDDFVAFEERLNERKLDEEKEDVRNRLLENEIINNVSR
ncbi:MAG: hypothetical protein ACI4N3_05135 [Alphaproteobacteria bacterium]